MSSTFYSRYKEILLKVSSILLVLLFFVAIEILVRIIFPAGPMDNMIDLGPINLFSKETINGETWYQISNKNAYSDRNTSFKEKKEKDQLRIICLGGSASAGWPHPPSEIYSTYLEKTLQTLYPSKRIEIINCSAHGFASYRIRQVFETIIPFQPDAVIVWSGNNEFLESRNYRTSELKNSLIKLRNNFRSLQLVRQFLTSHRFDDTPDVAETFWKKVNEEALELRTNPEQFEKVKEHYLTSMRSIVESAERSNIGLMFMTVPVNLRDWEPNVSILGLNPTDSIRWEKEFKEGKKNYLTKQFPSAITSFGRASKIAPLHAETYFWLAKAYENINDSLSALRNYTNAKDFDYNPFRAISDFNHTLRTLAQEHPQVVLLDMEHLLKSYSDNGIPGFDMFLDYVHPTKEGNLIIAYGTGMQIINNNLFSLPAPSERLTLQKVREISVSDYREENDMYLQFTRFSLCCITHQYYSALHFAKILKSNAPTELSTKNSEKINVLNDAISTFQPYVDLEQKSLTQETSADEQATVQNNIRLFYKKYFPYGAY